MTESNRDPVGGPAADESSLFGWVRRWQANGPLLRELERERLERLDLAAVIEALDDAFEAALRNQPRRRSSGLVLQQEIFARNRP